MKVLGNAKDSISAHNSISKSKRGSIDNANAAGISSDEARQLYCRIDSRKHSHSSLQNAQGMVHGLSQVSPAVTIVVGALMASPWFGFTCFST